MEDYLKNLPGNIPAEELKAHYRLSDVYIYHEPIPEYVDCCYLFNTTSKSLEWTIVDPELHILVFKYGAKLSDSFHYDKLEGLPLYLFYTIEYVDPLFTITDNDKYIENYANKFISGFIRQEDDIYSLIVPTCQDQDKNKPKTFKFYTKNLNLLKKIVELYINTLEDKYVDCYNKFENYFLPLTYDIIYECIDSTYTSGIDRRVFRHTKLPIETLEMIYIKLMTDSNLRYKYKSNREGIPNNDTLAYTVDVNKQYAYISPVYVNDTMLYKLPHYEFLYMHTKEERIIHKYKKYLKQTPISVPFNYTLLPLVIPELLTIQTIFPGLELFDISSLYPHVECGVLDLQSNEQGEHLNHIPHVKSLLKILSNHSYRGATLHDYLYGRFLKYNFIPIREKYPKLVNNEALWKLPTVYELMAKHAATSGVICGPYKTAIRFIIEFQAEQVAIVRLIDMTSITLDGTKKWTTNPSEFTHHYRNVALMDIQEGLMLQNVHEFITFNNSVYNIIDIPKAKDYYEFMCKEYSMSPTIYALEDYVTCQEYPKYYHVELSSPRELLKEFIKQSGLIIPKKSLCNICLGIKHNILQFIILKAHYPKPQTAYTQIFGQTVTCTITETQFNPKVTDDLLTNKTEDFATCLKVFGVDIPKTYNLEEVVVTVYVTSL